MVNRILCLIDGLCQGGAERQLIGLADLLHEKNYDVTLLSYHGEGFYYKELLEKKYKVITLNLKNSRTAKLFSIYKIIRENKIQTIIAYKHGPAITACLLKIVKPQLRVIVSERITTQELNLFFRIKFFLYKWADFIVPNSKSQGDFISQNYPSLRKKLRVITNFTDVDYFTPLYQDNNNDDFIILTAARISSQKNILNYLEALCVVKNKGVNFRCNWYGEVQGEAKEYFKKVKDKIKELNLQSVISFYPATSNILKLYRECDVFCLPSFYEGYPNVICEAMSCGKTILCSDVCDNASIIENGKNGLLFNPYDINDISDKLYQICSLNPSKRLEWSRCSREIALNKFSKTIFVNKYIELIEKQI